MSPQLPVLSTKFQQKKKKIESNKYFNLKKLKKKKKEIFLNYILCEHWQNILNHRNELDRSHQIDLFQRLYSPI